MLSKVIHPRKDVRTIQQLWAILNIGVVYSKVLKSSPTLATANAISLNQLQERPQTMVPKLLACAVYSYPSHTKLSSMLLSEGGQDAIA